MKTVFVLLAILLAVFPASVQARSCAADFRGVRTHRAGKVDWTVLGIMGGAGLLFGGAVGGALYSQALEDKKQKKVLDGISPEDVDAILGFENSPGEHTIVRIGDAAYTLRGGYLVRVGSDRQPAIVRASSAIALTPYYNAFALRDGDGNLSIYLPEANDTWSLASKTSQVFSTAETIWVVKQDGKLLRLKNVSGMLNEVTVDTSTYQPTWDSVNNTVTLTYMPSSRHDLRDRHNEDVSLEQTEVEHVNRIENSAQGPVVIYNDGTRQPLSDLH